MTCQLRKRKRAISVDNVNEQKDDESKTENTNEISKLIQKRNLFSDLFL
jgi:hypothetical protein